MVNPRLAAAALVGVLIGVPLSAQTNHSDLAALSTLQPGQWTLHGLDASSHSKSLCIADLRAFLQIEHGKAQCGRFVISDTPGNAVVHYTCPGQGHGQTRLRVETPRLIQIDSQGVHDNQPFAVSYEARRVGECRTLVSSSRTR